MTTKSIFKAKRVANSDVSGWLKDHAVIVENGVITSIESSVNVSSPGDSYDVHDLGDVSLLPGLIDAHSHMHCSATHDAQALALSFLLELRSQLRQDTAGSLVLKPTPKLKCEPLYGTSANWVRT